MVLLWKLKVQIRRTLQSIQLVYSTHFSMRHCPGLRFSKVASNFVVENHVIYDVSRWRLTSWRLSSSPVSMTSWRRRGCRGQYNTYIPHPCSLVSLIRRPSGFSHHTNDRDPRFYLQHTVMTMTSCKYQRSRLQALHIAKLLQYSTKIFIM